MRALLATVLLVTTSLAAPASADPLAVDLGPFQSWVPSAEAGKDAEGYPDASLEGLTFGPCGCNCPVVGAGAALAAAGQRIRFFGATALVICGVLYDVEVDSGALNQSAGPSITPRIYVYPGGTNIPDPRDVIAVTLPGMPPLP